MCLTQDCGASKVLSQTGDRRIVGLYSMLHAWFTGRPLVCGLLLFKPCFIMWLLEHHL